MKAKQEEFESLKSMAKSGRERTSSETEEKVVALWVISGDPRHYDLEFGSWISQIVAD
jgi:hypothetical protein